MATSLASNVRWTSNAPEITFDFSYEKKREGTTQYYKVTVSCDPLTGSSYFEYAINLELKLAGTKVATKVLKEESVSYKNWSSALTYTTGWLSVPNKTDGTTALAIRIYSTYRDATYNYDLPIDPAASTISATDANIESTSTINIIRQSTKHTTTVSYKAAGQNSYTEIWAKKTHTSYGWTIPESLYSLIPNAKEIEIELRCQTYSGSTLIGTETCKLTATTSASKCRPTVSVNAYDSNSNTVTLTGSNKKIIKGFSNLTVATTATANKSSSISSVKVKCGSTTKTGTSVTFNGAESEKFTVTVTDSRGYTVNATVDDLTLIEYIKPTIVASASRPSPTSDSVTIAVKGDWFNASFGNSTNTLTVDVRYKPKSQSEYADSDKYKTITVTKSGNTYSGSITLTGLAYTSAYNIRVRVRDAIHVYDGPIADPVYKNTEINKGIPVFDWGESDFNFNVNVLLQQHLTFANNTPSIRGTTASGEVLSALIPCNGKGNLVLGYGGYDKEIGATNIYGNTLNFYTKSDISFNHSGGTLNLIDSLGKLTRVINALTTPYDCDCTVTDTENYSGCTATATLVGNSLRLSVTLKRTSSTGTGNISNETAMKIRLKHGGKIKNLYNVSFASGITGTVATFQSDNDAIDDNTREISVKICAVAGAGTEWNAHFVMPCTINLAAYT